MCHHTREPTMSRVSMPPFSAEFQPFSPALPVTLAHFVDLPAGQGQVRTVIHVLYSGNITVLQAGRLFLRASQTVPRQDVISPFSTCGATSDAMGVYTLASSEPSRVRRRQLYTCLGDPTHLATYTVASSVDSALALAVVITVFF